MSFRNPLHQLPASAITGQITGSQIAPTAIDGMTITGAIVQTAASGARVVLSGPDDMLEVYDDTDTLTTLVGGPTGTVESYSGTGVSLDARLDSGIAQFGDSSAGWAGAGEIAAEADGVTLQILGNSTPATPAAVKMRLISGTASGILQVSGRLQADNISTGTVTITPVANTPTSTTVSGLTIPGTNFRAYIGLDSSVPGTQVLGCSANNVSGSGLTVWLTRTNTTPTSLWWMIIGE